MSLRIVAASTGRQAIDHCRAQLPDLVIMDVQMPGMSGLQATGAIRALPGGADVPILALTAQAMKGDRDRILEAGCDAYLPKPVAPRELRATVTLTRSESRRRTAAGVSPEGGAAWGAYSSSITRPAIAGRPRARSASASRSWNQVESVATALVRAAEAGHPFVLVSPAMLEASLGARPSSSGDLLRETFDVFEDGVCLLARNGALKVANAIGERLFRSTLQAELQSVASEASTRSATVDRSLTLDGRAFAVRAYPLSERGVVLYIRDATDEREREIGRLQSEKLASIGMLAAGVAHEINNPAAFVLANIEALTGHMRLIEDKLRDLPDAGTARAGLSNLLFEASAILQESKEGMARIQRIVRDLGSFSHADEDVNVPISVNAAVESALTMLRNELKYRARVEQDLRATPAGAGQRAPAGTGVPEPDLERGAGAGGGERQAQPGPRAQLRRRRARRRRGVGQRAGHRARGGAAHLRVVLHDQAARDGDRARPADLARASCAAWAARSSSTAGPGEGATFRVRIPATAVAPASRRRCPTRRRRASSCGAASWPSTTRRCCSRPTAACWANAHELVIALGGHEALGVLEKDAAFDVVLCDLQMPEMSGMELHAAVRRTLPGARDRFVFVTGGAFSGDARRFLEESVSGRHPEAVQRRRSAGADRHHRLRGGQAPRRRRRRRRRRSRRCGDLTGMRARKLVVAALVRAQGRVLMSRRRADQAMPQPVGVPGRQGRAGRSIPRRRWSARCARSSAATSRSTASTRSCSTPTRTSICTCWSTRAGSRGGEPRAVEVAEVAWVEAAALPRWICCPPTTRSRARWPRRLDRRVSV